MSAVLFCKTGTLAGAQYEISNEATIGKSNNNNIVLYPEIISSSHARIFYDDDEKSYFIEDLNSSNGTQVDGTLVTGIEKLSNLQIITFANKFDFIFQSSGSFPAEIKADKSASAQAAPQQPQPTPTPPVQPTPQPAPTAEAEKTMVQAMDAPLPKLGGKPPTPAPPPPDNADVEKTMIGQPMDAPLPKLGGQPQAPVAPPTPSTPTPPPPDKADVEKTIIGQPMDAPLPKLGGQPPASPTPPTPTPPAAPPVDDDATVAMAQPQPQAKVDTFILKVESSGKTYPLKQGDNKVGRTIDCDVVIEGPSLSRHHATITLSPQGLTISDNGSKNKTYVNNQPISTSVTIDTESEIKFGDLIVRIVKE